MGFVGFDVQFVGSLKLLFRALHEQAPLDQAGCGEELVRLAGAGCGIRDVGGVSNDWKCQKVAGAEQKKCGTDHNSSLKGLAKMTNQVVSPEGVGYAGGEMRDGLRKFSILVGLVVWIGAAQKPPVLIRVHLQAPEGAKGQVSVPVTLFQPNESIAIQSIPEVTEKEIRRISTRQDGTVMINFDEFGQTKLEVGTSTGRGLIMVVIVNGRVVYAPRIDTVITRGVLLLPAGSVTPEEIAQVNEEIEQSRIEKLKELRR